MKFIKKLIHFGQGVFILNYDIVELAVVYVETPGPIFLFHEDNGRSKWAVAWFDDPISQHLLNLPFYLVLLSWRVALWFHINWFNT